MENTTKSKKQVPISVYLRQRPQNSQERMPSAGGCVLEIHGPKHISVTHGQERDYQFNHVFGPDSRQVEVYQTVLEPLITEVLGGYNCTVFAYGQTGTGKTYTVVGEYHGYDGAFDQNPNAGLILRAAIHIFKELRRSTVKEFTVRVSFIELYNEELNDLLQDETVPLRLFEDPKQKGSVVIQNLSEVTVCSAEDVYNLLKKGMERRQTAATLLNNQSSRSHSVFTISIYKKEALITGKEIFKMGKLNLVDLAGSENISRSGAQNTRAREAGSINQSLLTLGRVIKCLVEQQHHVPYRDSKLTRILQDSLGGHTKTSLIATVSPSMACLEETVSTLDYAQRACKIINCPEVNRGSSKTEVVDELRIEVERTKQDLAALRSSEGFYVDAENYQHLLTETEQNKKLILDRNEIILRLEEKMNLTKERLQLEQKRWDELMESFKFTESKFKAYRGKNLKTMAKCEVLKQLTDLHQECAQLTLEKNRMCKESVPVLSKQLNQFYLKLEKNYQQSEEHKAASEGLYNVLVEYSREVDQILNKQEEQGQVINTKLTDISKGIVTEIERVIRRTDENEENFSNLDLNRKADEVQNYYRELDSQFNDFQQCMEEDTKSFTDVSVNHVRNAVTKIIQEAEDFKSELKEDCTSELSMREGLCRTIEDMKKQQLNEVSDVRVLHERQEQLCKELGIAVEFAFKNMGMVQMRKEVFQELRKLIDEGEMKADAEYSHYSDMYEKVKMANNSCSSLLQSAIHTSVETRAQLESTMAPGQEFEIFKSRVTESEDKLSTIVDDYVAATNNMKSTFEVEMRDIRSKALSDLNKTIAHFTTSAQTNCTTAINALNAINSLSKTNRDIYSEHVREILSCAEQIAEAGSYVASVFQQVGKKFAEEKPVLTSYKNKLLNVEPSGETPKKMDYSYGKDLIGFQMPTPLRNYKNDESVLDISISSLNISSVPPEEVDFQSESEVSLLDDER